MKKVAFSFRVLPLFDYLEREKSIGLKGIAIGIIYSICYVDNLI